MTLRGARILSSCNDASNKQEQKMNVNIKLEDTIPQPQQPFYPQVSEAQVPYRPVPQMTNFTIPQQTIEEFASHPLPNGVAPSQSTVHSINPCQSRDIDLSKDILQKGCYNSPEYDEIAGQSPSSLMTKDLQIADLEDKNKFLQLLLRIYQNNPLYINSLVVCQSQDFMDLVKLLTKCDETKEMKYGYNEAYSKLISFNISTKIVC